MPLTARQPLTSSYSVEVSGWDNSHTFFVEKSELSWNEETGKFLTLSHELHQHTMIFVRLLQPVAAERTFPVAYEAEPHGFTSEGQQVFRVTRMVPRSEPLETSR
ncbi:MAG TPA: hypothetical protein VE263_18435 [Candidatus Angelobacter sp.]|nr:hypothetical protein [Candidatus Angelobacter sp.]